MYYSIKDFAKMFDTTEHTIRYYTDIGLLPCERDSGNRRVFTEVSANWMTGIECLKKSGATLEEIKKYCELCQEEETEENLRKRYEIILHQKELAAQKLEEAVKTLEYMERKVEHYEKILNGVIPDDMNPQKWNDKKRKNKSCCV